MGNKSLPVIDMMEKYAQEHHIPIMEKDGIELLKQLIRLHQPKQILEVGTAIGYSAIQMALTLPNLHITSIEKDENRYNEAIKNVDEAGLSQRIKLVLADASDYLEELDESYDFVFIDAAKGQYQRYFEQIHPCLVTGGLMVIDNVLFKGYVSKEVQDKDRLVKLGEKINRFNKWLIQHQEYDTTILETGDGVALALKR
ncbi:O-methyltransferase [Filobacillus milosensis]|uniref:tRNA 5-hydroxyuridine methyltransferase n=2 Tax=Filobacillus milosensis TaxID=94137 RepID=A0A4Y8ISH2_9BACI|nr:O-methyltransferase [Filobacillus milosensis]